MALVTVTERKEREAKRRRAEAARIMKALSLYASEHGGKYIVFGTTARNAMTFRSDFDVLVDFPPEKEHDAFSYVEDLCMEARLPIDVMGRDTMSDRFMIRNQGEMIVLQ